MRTASCSSAGSRIRFAGLLWAAVGCLATACALLPRPEVAVRTLRSGSVAVDSTGIVFDLGADATAASQPTLCMIIDTVDYVFRPRAEKFHPLPLTDTTVYPRVAGTQTPIALRAVLEGRNDERAASIGGGYAPGTGMDTLENRSRLLGEEGEEVCLAWNGLRPDVTYVKVRLRSTRPIVVHEVTWHHLSRRST